MTRTGEVTFKGSPVALAGRPVRVGQPAPDFTLRYFDGGLKTLMLDEFRGKPTLISVVPSLDTGVCATQTRRFNSELAALGDSINALTVSVDLPFAQGRFCSDNKITNMRWASDYFDRSFGRNWGMLIEELQLLARGVFVLDAEGNVVYTELVKEVATEPNYAAALEALKGQLAAT